MSNDDVSQKHYIYIYLARCKMFNNGHSAKSCFFAANICTNCGNNNDKSLLFYLRHLRKPGTQELGMKAENVGGISTR